MTPPLSSFVLRKQFPYRSKYNLINLLRDLENSLRDFTKGDINMCCFTFKKSCSSVVSSPNTAAAANRQVSNEEVFDDEQLYLLKESGGSSNSTGKWLQSDLHFVDDFDYDIDFANLKRTHFACLHDALSRSQNLIITMNSEYGAGLGGALTLTASGTNSAAPTNVGIATNPPLTPGGGISYNRVPSFGNSRDKEQQQQLLQNIAKIEFVYFILS